MSRGPGLTAALTAAGGCRALARRLGVSHQAVKAWNRVPQARLFDVARAAGVAAEVLRPDLAEFVAAERARQRMAAARERFSLVKAAVGEVREDPRRSLNEQLVDQLVTFAAVRFVAREREMGAAQVLVGRHRPEMGARAWAMALALVAGRASATAIGAFFGTSRQNVDNAGLRYLRARDGDDPDDFLEGGKVLERGRLRPAKSATVDLWAAEARFTASLEGDGAQPERKKA